MPIINLTAHPIRIIDNYVYSPTIRKNVVPDGKNTHTRLLIPSYTSANGKYKTIKLEDFEGCPVRKKEVVGCDGLPKVDDPENTIFIVSTAYAKAYQRMHPKADMSNFYIIGEAVYSTDGQHVLGSTCIIQWDY